MKIGTKLFLWLAIPMVTLILVFGYIDGRLSRDRLREELEREGRAISRTVQVAVEDALRDRQIEDVQELVDSITGYERIFGLRLFDAQGNIRYQSKELERHTFAHRAELQRVLATGHGMEFRRKFDDLPVVSFINPIFRPDSTVRGAVQVFQLESFIDEDVRSSRNRIAVLTGIMILASAVVISLVTRLVVTRPIDALAQGFRDLGEGRDPRMPGSTSEEFDRLASEFRAMCARLEAAKRSLEEEQEERRRIEANLRNTARLASLGELAAGLAHEIGTPLGVITGRTEVLQARLSDNDQAQRSLGIVLEQIDRISRIVRSMLSFAKVRELHLADVDVRKVLEDTLEFVGHHLEDLDVEVGVSCREPLPAVRGDRENIQEVFLNLVLNGADAMPAGGRLEVKAQGVRRVHADHGSALDVVEVEFRDDGVGIAQEHIDRIFDPFFTTKEVGKGTGLGLSISYGIVREHGGWMEVDSEPGRGTAMRVLLPVGGPSEERSELG